MQSGASDYSAAIPLAPRREALARWALTSSEVTQQSPILGSDRSLSHWGGFSCVSSLPPSAQPCGFP